MSIKYMITIIEDSTSPNALRFTFVPARTHKLTSELNTKNEAPSQYVLSIDGYGKMASINWINPPTDPAIQEHLATIAKERTEVRDKWIKKLQALVSQINEWANNLDWSTKLIEKRMEDAEIGNYRAPALLLQQDLVRIFLEPISRKGSPGTEGLVDLYLMPSYDDIASLYFYNNEWQVHYMFHGMPLVGDNIETPPQPLTKNVIEKLLSEMKANAA